MIITTIKEMAYYLECPYRWLYRCYYDLPDKPKSNIDIYLDLLRKSVLQMLSSLHRGESLGKKDVIKIWEKHWFENKSKGVVGESDIWYMGLTGSYAMMHALDDFSRNKTLSVGGISVPVYKDITKGKKTYRFFGTIDAILYSCHDVKRVMICHLSTDKYLPDMKMVQSNIRISAMMSMFLDEKDITRENEDAMMSFMYTHLRTCRQRLVPTGQHIDTGRIIDSMVSIAKAINNRLLYLRSDYERCNECGYKSICNISHANEGYTANPDATMVDLMKTLCA